MEAFRALKVLVPNEYVSMFDDTWCLQIYDMHICKKNVYGSYLQLTDMTLLFTSPYKTFGN